MQAFKRRLVYPLFYQLCEDMVELFYKKISVQYELHGPTA